MAQYDHCETTHLRPPLSGGRRHSGRQRCPSTRRSFGRHWARENCRGQCRRTSERQPSGSSVALVSHRCPVLRRHGRCSTHGKTVESPTLARVESSLVSSLAAVVLTGSSSLHRTAWRIRWTHHSRRLRLATTNTLSSRTQSSPCRVSHPRSHPLVQRSRRPPVHRTAQPVSVVSPRRPATDGRQSWRGSEQHRRRSVSDQGQQVASVPTTLRCPSPYHIVPTRVRAALAIAVGPPPPRRVVAAAA